MAEGQFDIPKPEVSCSISEIKAEVGEGGTLEGEFQIVSNNEEEIRGFVMSTNSCMHIVSEQQFVTRRYTISYQFVSREHEVGQKECGSFVLVTNGGEISIPYEITIKERSLMIGGEEISNFDDFLEFATEKKEEALMLFYSKEFEQTLLAKNREQQLLYRALLQGRNHAQAMEEFFVSIHKKERVVLESLVEQVIVQKDVQEYKIPIKRNAKGYVDAIVESNSAYVHLEKERLKEEDFEDGIAMLTIRIASNSRSIHNWNTSLKLCYQDQTITIPVIYDALEQGRTEREALKTKREWKQSMLALYDNWFLYHTGHREVEQYKNYERTFALAMQKEEGGRKIPLPDDYYVHLLNQISEGTLENKKKKRKAIISLYEKGNRSPFLLYELVKDMNEEPMLLQELHTVLISALKWATSYQFVSEPLIDRFMQLVAHEKKFSTKVFWLVKKFYEQTQQKEYLSILCSFLIKGDRMDNKYHEYYALGIKHSLKLIGLCEAFIRSMDRTQYSIIPRSVLLYFVDAETLADTEKEYVFANILYHEREYDGILYQYGEKIQSFIKEQMKKGNMSHDLLYLYKRNFDTIIQNEEMLSYLANIIFKQKIICNNPFITGVIVYHQETKRIEYASFVNQMAYIDCYTEHHRVIVVDQEGRYYATSMEFEVEPLFDHAQYMRLCYEYAKKNTMLLYRLGCHTLKYQQSDARAMSVIRSVLTIADIDENFYWECLEAVLAYYDQCYEEELFEEYLKKVDLLAYKGKSRCTMIEYMITRKRYAPVLKNIEQYGFHGIAPQKLLSLISYLLTSDVVQRDELLLDMCMYAFEQGVYDMYSLEYIGKYRLTSLKELLHIWKVAKEQSLCIHELEENILAQSLFAELIYEELFPVFHAFFQRNETNLLVKAFLRYVSYDSFMKEYYASREFYLGLQQTVIQGTLSDDFSKMSLLYYMANEEEIEKEHMAWLCKTVQEFIMKGMVLPFFEQFSRIVSLPLELLTSTYLCYRGEKHKNYYINYQFRTINDGKQEIEKEIRMNEIMPGIYTIEFVIFHNEEVSYKICKREQQEETIEISGILKEKSMPEQNEKHRVALLNEMIHEKEQGNNGTIEQIAKEYIEKIQLMNLEWTLL